MAGSISQFAKGYQAALADILAALDEGGIEGALDWIANNGTPELKDTLNRLRELST